MLKAPLRVIKRVVERRADEQDITISDALDDYPNLTQEERDAITNEIESE